MTQDTSSYTDLTTKNPFVLTLLTAPGSAALRIENSELSAAIQVDETQHGGGQTPRRGRPGL
jgi:hypothetical protein